MPSVLLAHGLEDRHLGSFKGKGTVGWKHWSGSGSGGAKRLRPHSRGKAAWGEEEQEPGEGGGLSRLRMGKLVGTAGSRIGQEGRDPRPPELRLSDNTPG